MEVVVQAASEVPQGCFVSVRLGEHLKQCLGEAFFWRKPRKMGGLKGKTCHR